MRKILGGFGLMVMVLVFALGLAGCSGGSPSAADVKKDVTAAVAEKTEAGKPTQFFDVVSCEKTNGKKVGDTGYDVEVKYSLKFKVSFDDFAKIVVAEEGFTAPVTLEVVKAKLGKFQKGETREYTKWFAYSKTEKGWKFDGEKSLM